jgi:hypothetical protein
MKRGLAVVLAIGLLGGLLAGGALAKKLSTSISLVNAEAGVYKGKVTSAKAACEKGRKVTVYHDENDNGLDPSDYRIGSDRTGKSGAYTVQGNQAPAGDTIIATVKRKKLKAGVCKEKEVDAVALSG